jgi:hypothetical protein
MHRGLPRIYLQVPAYRDPQLVPTLRDLLDTAARPEQLARVDRSSSGGRPLDTAGVGVTV